MKHLNLNDVARNAKRGALKAFREYLNKMKCFQGQWKGGILKGLIIPNTLTERGNDDLWIR